MFERFLSANGLRVILVPQAGSLATTVMVLVEAGSKYETKELNGISHFLEHMVFKGTERRPTALKISSELDGLGAQYNAFTGQEHTGYYAKVKNEFFSRAFDVVADLYLNPTFPEAEIEKEKGVIIEEINMYEDLPQRRVQELFMECVYGDQPAGWSIAGRKEVIRRIGRSDFINYRGAHYVPKATVVVIAGGFDEAEARAEIESKFGGFHEAAKDQKTEVVDKQTKPQELVFHKASDQTHLVLGFRAFGVHDDRKYALQVLTDILGGGMSSRLFQKIREEMGAAYYVRASDDLYSDHGLVTMSAGVQHEKLEDVIKAGLEEFARLRKEPVPEEELQRTKDHLIGNLALSLETSDELASFYGGQEVMNLPIIEMNELADRIKRVKAEEVQNLARDLFRDAGLNLSVIGPFKDKSFRDILKV